LTVAARALPPSVVAPFPAFPGVAAFFLGVLLLLSLRGVLASGLIPISSISIPRRVVFKSFKRRLRPGPSPSLMGLPWKNKQGKSQDEG